MITLSALDYAVLAVYIAITVSIGLAVTTKIKGFRDYFSASGALTTPLLVCTLVSSYYGLEATLSTSEVGFDYGLVAWFWYARPYYVAIFIAAFVISRRLKGSPFWSLPDVLEDRYGRWTRITGAIACFVYCLPIVSIAGLGTLFEVMGWPKGIGLTVGMCICLTYTLFGGLWADVITDTVQFVVICVSLAIAMPYAVHQVGGFRFTETLPVRHMTTTGGIDVGLIVSYCAAALTIFVEPTFYQRIFAAKDEKAVRRALLIGLVMWAAYDWSLTLFGMLARAAVEQGIMAADTPGREALIRVCLVALPIGLRGLFVGGILAIAMANVDSYSLLASSNLVYDIYRPLRRGQVSDRMLLLLTRVGVALVTVLGVVVSLFFERIAHAWIFMASVLTSVVFVPVMGAIYGRPKPLAGLLSCATGLAALIAFHVLVHGQGEYDEAAATYRWMFGGVTIWREYAVLAALPVSLAGFVVGQVLGKAKTPSELGEAVQ